jgi:polysaccharide pyruvyl transferase WcaK-like protein
MANRSSNVKDQHPDRCLVWGGYGWGNTGDDLTLAIAVQDLRKVHGMHLSLLTPRSEHTSVSHPGVQLVAAPWDESRRTIEHWLWRLADHASSQGRKEEWSGRWCRLALRFHRRRPVGRNWLNAFGAASVLHLVGGGYLTDVFDLRYMLRPIRVARAVKLPVTTSPLGIGPFADTAAATAVARALQGVRVVVRDEASLHFCHEHGLTAEERPDDGFRLREVIDAKTIPEPDTGAPPSIGVCIFSQFSGHWSSLIEQWWVECLRSMARAFPRWSIEGFCFHTDQDMDFRITRRLFGEAGLDPNAVQAPHPDYRAAIASLGNLRAIVSTRFHALVAASVLEIPCVAVALNDYYEIKMRSALRHARNPIPWLNPTQCSPDALVRQLQQALGGGGGVRHAADG